MLGTNRRLLPFYLSYAVGLIAPIILGLLLFFRTSELAEREIDIRVQFALERAAVDIESIYGDVEFIVTQATLSESIVDLSATSFVEPLDKYRRLLDLVFDPAFVDNTAFSRFVLDYYLLLPTPDLVLGSSGIMSMNSFYAYEFSIADLSLSEFRGTYLQERFSFELRREQASIGLHAVPQETVILLHSVGARPDSGNRLLFVIDRRELEKELRAASFEEGSAVFVLGRNDEVVASFVNRTRDFDVVLPEDPIRGAISEWTFPGDSSSFEVISPDGDVRIVAHIAHEVYTSRTGFVRRTTLLLVAVVLALDIALVVLFSRRNARPLSEMLALVQSELQSRARPGAVAEARFGSSIRYVERQLNRVIEQKHGFQDELERQRPVLTSLILQSLVHGIRIQDEELRGLLARSGIRLNTGFRCCIVMTFGATVERVADDIFDEFVLKKLLLEEAFHKSIRGNVSFLYQSYERLVVIHGADSDDKALYHERLVADLRKAIESLRRDYAADVVVGVGNPYYTLSRISSSFEEASIAAEEYAPLGPDNFAVYAEYVNQHQSYHYPVEFELRVLNATRHGSEEGVRELMKVVRIENFERRSLGRDPILILFGEIRGTIAKLDASIETAVGEANEAVYEFAQRTYGPENREQFFDDAEEVLVELAVFFRERVRRSRSGIDPSKVTSYLEQNFQNSSLSLTVISDAFGVSEKYFSRYFKDQFRINFHAYLEGLRLAHVRDQLRATNVPISDIVEAAGYASSATCSRAFKRRYGISPSEFRAAR